MATEKFEKYGVKWPAEMDELQVEMGCIRKGGKWIGKSGHECGLGYSYHFEQMRRIIWPELDGEHNGQRWHPICRDGILNNKVCVLMGPGSSGKTHEAAWIALCEWMSDPENTCVLVSSTDMRGLRMRVWAEICALWEKAVQRFDYLPGHMLDSKLAITATSLDDDGDINNRSVRSFRSAIVGIPTVQNGKNVGLGKWIGIKQNYVRLVADEAQMMGPSFLSAFANLNKNVRFGAIVLGNPSDPLDSLGKCAEPIDGWETHMNPEKTSVWKTRFMDGVCVNLIGTDSPSMDFPDTNPPRFPYLINRQKIEETASFFSRDSYEFASQCIGSMRISSLARRVLTRKLCETNRALSNDVVWKDSNRVKVAGLDSAYSGDRCVFYRGEFGQDITGKTILLLQPPLIVPITMVGAEPEQQISEFVKRECISAGIPPENFCHDSTGRGSLGTFLARVWSAQTNPIEFGGQPGTRPVSLDHWFTDPVTKLRRLKMEKEHYSKTVSALWFAVRYCVEAGQLRGLSEETMDEGCMREWSRVQNDKLELENKADCKLRTGRSPDLMDACCLVVEMARRRGFQISKLANDEQKSKPPANSLITNLARSQAQLVKAQQLDYSQG